MKYPNRIEISIQPTCELCYNPEKDDRPHKMDEVYSNSEQFWSTRSYRCPRCNNHVNIEMTYHDIYTDE